MKPYMIRNARAKDAEELIEMINEVAGETHFHTFTKGDYNRSIDEQVKVIDALNASENSLFMVASNSEDIIGMLTINGGNSIRSYHRGDLGIIIRKKYWHMGIGTSMVENALEWARANERLIKVNLLVHEENVRAISIYERLVSKSKGDNPCIFLRMTNIMMEF